MNFLVVLQTLSFYRRYLLPACFLLLWAVPLSAQTLRLVTEEWPALIDNTTEGADGILWDISRDVLEGMGYQVEIEFVPWKRAQRLVLEGKRDGIVGIGFTRDRGDRFRFPAHHLLISETAVFSRRDRHVPYTGVASLAGLKVGVSPGYSYSSEVREATHFEKVDMPAIDSGLKMLMLGRVDAILVNRYVAWSEAERMGIAGQLVASEQAISGGPVYLAFRPGISPRFLETFSAALGQYKKARLITDLYSGKVSADSVKD